MSIQSRISLTLSPRMRKALELAAGLEGSTTATYASQLLGAALKRELKEDPILLEKWIELEKEAIKNESWDRTSLPINIALEEATGAQELPAGWFLSGDNRAGYEIGADPAVLYRGKVSGYLGSKS